jgi:hypothetical protein
MNTTTLAGAYETLLSAAGTVNTSVTKAPPAGEWGADQVLAHVSLVTALTLRAVSSTAAGTRTTYDNRIALDTWTIEHLASTSGRQDLCSRIRVQGGALVDLVGTLHVPELATDIPTVLISHDELLVDQCLPLSDLLTGLADVELPGHTQQLLGQLP